MKNVVTPETAQKLKEAGFPQPQEMEVLQVWYGLTSTGRVVIIVDVKDGCGIDQNGNYHTKKGLKTFGTFAPTATDILSDLGNDYHTGMLDGVFVSGLHQFGQSDLQFNYNPAEAAASAWLEKYAK